MLESIITSKTRIKLLLKFFSNPQTTAYLRGLADELGENTNAIRLELNNLSKAGLLSHEQDGNTILYKANIKNPFFKQLHRLVMKYMGLDDVVESIVNKVGPLQLAFITGSYAKGQDTGIIDLVLVADSFDLNYLQKLHKRAEEICNRKIRLLTLHPNEFQSLISSFEMNHSLILYATLLSGYSLPAELND
jgi:hypothetical protein